MGKQRRVPYYHHPLFTSVLPGVGGLSLGFILTAALSMTAYHFTNLFASVEYPNVAARQVTRIAAMNAGIPLVVFFVSLVIGGALAVLYRRNLRRHEDLLVAGLLLSPRERWERLPLVQALRIYWPLLVLGIVFCGVGLVEGGALTPPQAMAGLVAGLGLTYHECRRIYERVLAEVRPDPEPQGLPLRAKLVAAFVVVLLACFAGLAVWFALAIEQSVLDIQEALSPLLPGPSAGPGPAP